MKLMGVFKCETYTGEDQCPQGAIDKAHYPVMKENAQEAEEQQDNQAHKQHAPTLCEVILGLPKKKKKKINKEQCQIVMRGVTLIVLMQTGGV